MLLVQKGVGTRSHTKKAVGTPFPPHYTSACTISLCLKNGTLWKNEPYQTNEVHILLGVCSYFEFGFLLSRHQEKLK